MFELNTIEGFVETLEAIILLELILFRLEGLEMFEMTVPRHRQHRRRLDF